MPLAFAAIAMGGVLVLAGVTGSSIASVVKGRPDHSHGEGLKTTGGTAAPYNTTSPTSNTTRAYVTRFFVSKGLSRAQAAGIAGNVQQESSFSGNLFQDIGNRARSGEGSTHQQLEAAWRELLGPESNALAALRRTSTPEAAARVFSELFERPGIPMIENRERYAREAYNEK